VTTPNWIALALVLALTGVGIYLLARYVLEQRAIAARAQASKTRAEILGWADEAGRVESVKSDEEKLATWKRNFSDSRPDGR